MSQYNLGLRLRYEQTCPDCGESDFVEDHAAGDLICRSCGIVVEAHIIDERSEWRTFGDKDGGGGVDPNRVGGPVNELLSDGGMSTMIGGGKGVDKGLVHNLQRMQARTEVAGDRALISAFRELGTICHAMKLNDTVRHQANEYFKRAHEEGKCIKGKPQAAVFAAIIFLACRQTGNPRSFKEITKVVVNAEKKDIGKAYKAIVAGLHLKESGEFNSEVSSVHPENYIRRFMSHLAMSQADMKHGVALANALMPQTGEGKDQHAGWYGKNPMTIAGACIWIVASLPRGTRVPLEDISKECGIAEQTIRQVYREIYPHLVDLVAKAGGFASREEIARLPTPSGLPSVGSTHFGAQQQQQQQQQPPAAAAPAAAMPTLQQVAAASQALLLAQAQARQAAAQQAVGAPSQLRVPSVSPQAPGYPR